MYKITIYYTMSTITRTFMVGYPARSINISDVDVYMCTFVCEIAAIGLEDDAQD